jgi:hypothetical protein
MLKILSGIIKKKSSMKTYQTVTVCRHCKTQIGFAVTTVGTRRSKVIAFLYCEACSLGIQVFWDSNPEKQNPDQLNLFNEKEKEG